MPIIGGGGGGASTSGSSWTTVIAADAMANTNNWTSQSGTWTTFGADGVESTGGGTDDYLSLNATKQPLESQYAWRAIQVTVKVVTSAAGNWAGVAFTKTGAYAAPNLSVGLDVGNNQVHYDQFGTSGGNLSYAAFGTLALNTSYVLRVVELDYGAHFMVWVAGNLLGVVGPPSPPISRGSIGLYARSSTAWYGTVSVYGIANPWGV